MRLSFVTFICILAAFAVVSLPVHGWGGGKECEQKPIQIFDFDANGGVHLNEEFLKFLRDHSDRLIIPISVVGTSRSGKSFFLNFVSGCNQTFAVDHKQLGKTKGAMALPMIPVDNGEKKGPLYLLIDTEGLAKEVTHDKVVLLLSYLLSSHIVYHLESKITEPDVSRLDDITRLEEVLKANGIFDRLQHPMVNWVIEKVTLEELHDLDELRNDVLKTVPGNTNPLREKTIKRIWDNQFHYQKPFYIKPARKNISDWVHLTDYSKDELEQDYLEKMEQVINILVKAKQKKLADEDQPLTCEQYADYVEAIIETVKTANDPVWDINKLMSFAGKRAVAAAQKVHSECMIQLVLPKNEDIWEMNEMECRNRSINKFNSVFVEEKEDEVNKHLDNAKMGLQSMFKEQKEIFFSQNVNETNSKCDDRMTAFDNELDEIWREHSHSPDYRTFVTNCADNYRVFFGTSKEKRICTDRWNNLRNKALKRGDSWLREHPVIVFTSIVVTVAVILAAIVTYPQWGSTNRVSAAPAPDVEVEPDNGNIGGQWGCTNDVSVAAVQHVEVEPDNGNIGGPKLAENSTIHHGECTGQTETADSGVSGIVSKTEGRPRANGVIKNQINLRQDQVTARGKRKK